MDHVALDISLTPLLSTPPNINSDPSDPTPTEKPSRCCYICMDEEVDSSLSDNSCLLDPLIEPCRRCAQSKSELRFAHASCLSKWINQDPVAQFEGNQLVVFEMDTHSCRLCKSPLSVEKRYLSPTEFVRVNYFVLATCCLWISFPIMSLLGMSKIAYASRLLHSIFPSHLRFQCNVLPHAYARFLFSHAALVFFGQFSILEISPGLICIESGLLTLFLALAVFYVILQSKLFQYVVVDCQRN
ncbi:hypothetical protein BJ742DRAFT_800273 [Cladochytrium replicatum]|nr:hypothetical protein BJ742DRAFT_800273 [Cladochytrium replicatum]